MNELKNFLDGLKIERELVTNFFITFSRFEYALKRAGYINNREDAVANWYTFLKKHKKDFESLCSDNFELQKAKKYLTDYPPQKQKYGEIEGRRKQLYFQKSNINSSEIHYILDLIKNVRNNLFHGGKYPFAPSTEPARNSRLLENSLIILETWLELDEQVKKHFFEHLK